MYLAFQFCDVEGTGQRYIFRDGRAHKLDVYVFIAKRQIKPVYIYMYNPFCIQNRCKRSTFVPIANLTTGSAASSRGQYMKNAKKPFDTQTKYIDKVIYCLDTNLSTAHSSSIRLV